MNAGGAGLGIGLALAGGLSWAGPSLGQENPSLEEIQVTAARTSTSLGEAPYAVSVIELGDVAAARPGFSIAETLDQVPGVFAQSRYNLAQDVRLAVRGFGATGAFGIRGIAVVVDGVPLTLPDGQSQVDAIDPSSVARVEVLRGPGSVLYGNAAGGVISISTRAEPDRLRLRTVVGGDGLRTIAANVGARDDQIAGGVRVSSRRYDGFRAHSQSETHVLSLWAATVAQQAWRLQGQLDVLDAPTARDPGAVTRALFDQQPRAARDRNVEFDAGEAVSQVRLSGSARAELAGGEWTFRGWWLDRDFGTLLPFEGGGDVTFARRYAGVQARYGVNLAGSARVDVGVDIADQRDDRQRYDNLRGVRGGLRLDQRESVRSEAIYAQYAVDIGPGWRVSAGLRRDRVRFNVRDALLEDGDDGGDVDFEETSYRVGVTGSLTDVWSGYAGVGRSFATPTTTELANPAGAGFNTDLAAQIADQFEVGLRARWPRGTLQLGVFAIDLADELVPFELADQPGRTFYRNAGSTTRLGAEAELQWQLASRWRVGADWTRARFRFDRFRIGEERFDGLRAPGSPSWLAGTRLMWQDERGHSAEFWARRVGNFYADNANQVRVDAYTTVGLTVSRAMPFKNARARLFAGVTNLLDERYNDNVRINAFGGRHFEAAPDRALHVGLDLVLP